MKVFQLDMAAFFSELYVGKVSLEGGKSRSSDIIPVMSREEGTGVR